MHVGLAGFEQRLKGSSISEERLKRLITLIRGWRSIGHILIALIMALMILHEFGLNITPVLASAGVIGLAFSLGAQTVIKDFLGGVVILTENQFTIGDVITVGALTGTVEHITLRATYLRDMEGKLHLIPNGDIRVVSNLTTQWAQVVITFNFDYDTDIAAVKGAMDKAIRRLQADDAIASDILDKPFYTAWSGFTDWSVQAQLVCRTPPGRQWAIACAVRQMALDCLHEAGICPAIPRQRIEMVS